jgi:hypothetical protein
MDVGCGDYVRVNSSQPIVPYEFWGREAPYLGALGGFDGDDGAKEDSVQLNLPAGHRLSSLLSDYFPALAGKDRMSGYLRISADVPIVIYAFFGIQNLLWGQAP